MPALYDIITWKEFLEATLMNDNLRLEVVEAVSELIDVAKLSRGDILVVGCSTSEVIGSKIGTNSSFETAEVLFDALYEAASERGVYLAIQCCEHLNRAIITERSAVPGKEIVNVVPQPKAGGSLATVAYSRFESPVAIESVSADAGLDIGGTLIGMHLKRVAVPVRLSRKTIGEAMIIAARTRPPFIGGCRAIYDESLL